MPRISVIVPNYNHAKYLKQRIDSILNQTFQDFELILLDDCSTDNSREILLSYQSHPKVTHIVFNEKNSGTAFIQWNKGIQLAKGEYVWIAESDDWAEPEFLEILLKEINNRTSIVLAYTQARHTWEDGEIRWKVPESGKTEIHTGTDFIRNKLLYANVVYNVSMTLFRKEIFERINHSVYEKMKLCGDWFFYTLLCEHGDVLILDKIYSNYRVHTTNTSQSAEKEGKSFLEGIDVLNYICSRIRDLPRIRYSFSWARQWVKYKRTYQFSHRTNQNIKKKISQKNKLILMIYYLYSAYYYLKLKKRQVLT